ncbi:unnamed protein product [Arctogadus glacialis]
MTPTTPTTQTSDPLIQTISFQTPAALRPQTPTTQTISIQTPAIQTSDPHHHPPPTSQTLFGPWDTCRWKL